jgi:malate dehydrogenase (oxaloacetate-decarboxylating)
MIPFHFIRQTDGQIDHIETRLSGLDLIRSGKLNKGSAFSADERERFGLLGKLPNQESTLEEQVARYYQQYQELQTDLSKNVYLNSLHDRNETAFFKLVIDNLKEMMPIVYTPTVGEAVEKFSLELRQPRGLFISYPDKAHIKDILTHRLNEHVDLILVTDGEGVLGIGDQGIGGMDIAIAKLMVYTLCAGLNPHRVLPIQLDVGTNNQALLDDPLYLGWRHERVTGQDYDDFIAAFVSAVQDAFPGVFLHWEDFGRDNARRNLERYRPQMLTFNDDMQGTGATALSCVLSGTQAAGVDLAKQQVVILGAGTAGCGIADQIKVAMVRKGASEAEAKNQIWLIDRFGLLVDDMPDLPDFQKPYAVSHEMIKDWQVADPSNVSLLDVVSHIDAGVLIGCSTVHGAFNKDVVKAMASKVKHPMILPLSNPTSKSEADPADVLKWSDGMAVVATGSPFHEVDFNGKKIRISQSNNAFVFPGLGLGAVAVKAKHMTDNMIWAACEALTDCSPAKNDHSAPVLPDLDDIHKVSHHIALAVAKQAIKDGEAEDCDIEKAIAHCRWEPRYYPMTKTR